MVQEGFFIFCRCFFCGYDQCVFFDFDGEVFGGKVGYGE